MRITWVGGASAVVLAGGVAAWLVHSRRTATGQDVPAPEGRTPVPEQMASLLACPHCHSPLSWEDAPGWRCARCATTYPVRDGIAHFLGAADLGPMDQRFAHLYDRFAPFYTAFTRVGFALLGMRESEARREVLDRLAPCGGPVLEVSVGPGSNLRLLVSRADVGQVHGLDISSGQLRRARALVRRHSWDVPLYHASAEALPFRDGTFAAVLHIGGINFFDDKAAALAEMARVARPGTRVVVADENERAARGYERSMPGFRASFQGQRARVSAPVADVPRDMEQVSVEQIWRGLFYCLEFVTPAGAAAPADRSDAPPAEGTAAGHGD